MLFWLAQAWAAMCHLPQQANRTRRIPYGSCTVFANYEIQRFPYDARELVHGWNDDIVPIENSLKYARHQKAQPYYLMTAIASRTANLLFLRFSEIGKNLILTMNRCLRPIAYSSRYAMRRACF